MAKAAAGYRRGVLARVGFTSTAEDCVSASPFGSPCRDQYVQGGQDEVSRRIAETAPKFAAVIQGIHERSPARVLVLNYSAIVLGMRAMANLVVPAA